MTSRSVRFEQATLPNGLTVVAETDPAAHTCAAGFFVRTGARDESPDIMGVSHFLEHMMFKGTARRSAEDLNREFDSLGARNNAYTSSELTCFHAAVLPENLPAALDLLADMLRPALRPDDFERERSVILEEIAMYMDNPFWVLYERTVEEFFASHPLSHRVLGTAATISALTRDQMERYFRSRYSADNTVVALAGRVDFDAAVRQIESLCSSWARTDASRDLTPAAPREREFTIADKKVGRAYQMMIAPAPAKHDPRRYPASVFASLIGNPDNSRFHWALIEPGLAEQAEFGFEPRDHAGEFLVFLVTDPQRADEAWHAASAELLRWRDHVSMNDVSRIVAKLATAVTLASERPDGRMQRLGQNWTYTRSYTSLEEELDRIRAVTLDDCDAMLRDFPLTPRTLGRLQPA